MSPMSLTSALRENFLGKGRRRRRRRRCNADLFLPWLFTTDTATLQLSINRPFKLHHSGERNLKRKRIRATYTFLSQNPRHPPSPSPLPLPIGTERNRIFRNFFSLRTLLLPRNTRGRTNWKWAKIAIFRGGGILRGDR